MPGCPRLACVASLFASTALFLTILSSPVRAAVTLGAPPPMITCPPDMNLECSESTDPSHTGSATATGGCADTVSMSHSDTVTDTNSCTGLAGIDRTWTATDPCGDAASCVQHIRFVDATPPVITCPADKDLQCGDSTDPSNTGTATASDNCGGTPGISHTDASTTGCRAGIDRTWKATDPCGNTATCVQHIRFVDTTPPVITCPADKNLECGESTDPNQTGKATASDNCSTTMIDSFDTQVPPAGCVSQNGIDRTWTATDVCGNTATCVQRIRFVDTTPPVITCPADKGLECGDSTDPSNTGTATASDNCGGTPGISRTDAQMTGCPAGIDRTWTASDACGNTATCVQHIRFVDNTPPVITLSSTTPVSPATLWPPNHTLRDVTVNYTVSDNCSGDVKAALSVSSNEPINGTGDGDTAPDWQIVDSHHLRLRAEHGSWGSMRVYTVTITATDACGSTATATVSVLVAHNITNPQSGACFKVNSTVNFAGTFWDVAGSHHTAQWAFDNLAAAGTVAEPSGLKAGTVSGNYTFSAAGVYKVTLNLTDQNGVQSWVNTAGDVEAIAVIYDPTAGYAIGGGWFTSPAGAYRAAPKLSGKVSYGFTSRYFKNATNPKGETQFEFKLAGLEFNALSLDYLVISGARAQFKGSGKLNGQASYNFILTVIDGQLSGGGGTDRIRMKIWDKTTGSVVYDSQPGASDTANPTTAVGAGGSIVIATTSAAAPLTASGVGSEGNEPAVAGEPGPVRSFGLSVVRPNPFRATTELAYSLPERSRVELSVYDVRGARVRVLVEGIEEAGSQSARFEAGGLEAGVYFAQLRATSLSDSKRQFTQVRKILMLR